MVVRAVGRDPRPPNDSMAIDDGYDHDHDDGGGYDDGRAHDDRCGAPAAATGACRDLSEAES